jgi:CheY-like chemotaxis protein
MNQANNGKPRGANPPRTTGETTTGPVAVATAKSGEVAVVAAKQNAPRVLVIDDSEVSRVALAEALERAGCQVFQLPSAIGATRLILRHNLRAVIVDVNMPGLSGDRLIAVLRSNPRLRDLAIIMVSGRSDVELETMWRETGADGALEKGRITTDLWPMLARVLGTRAAERGK